MSAPPEPPVPAEDAAIEGGDVSYTPPPPREWGTVQVRFLPPVKGTPRVLTDDEDEDG